MDTLWQDIRYGIRMLMKKPGFTVVAVMTLALGIGANTAIFSVIYGVLLKPLPYEEPDRLVRIFERSDRFPKWPVAPGNFLDYRAENRTFEGVALYLRSDLQLAQGERPEHLSGMRVTSGFFRLLGWQPALGRDFLPEEELQGNHRVVILSHSLWERRFARDPAIVGRAIHFSGVSFTVVGVLPPGFQHVGGTYRTHGHGEVVDIWRPLTLGPDPMPRGQHYTNAIGRLREGVTREHAEEEMRAIAARLAEKYPQSNGGWTISLAPLREEIVGAAKPMLLILVGAVGLVLLIACVNVATLMLGRSTARVREIAVRSALGASRGRIVRQMLVESSLLAVVGGVGGLLLAFWSVDALVALSPEKLPRLHMIGIDVKVLGFTVGLTLVTGLLFGIAPALQITRGDPAGALKEGGRTSGAGLRSQRLHRSLVAVEVGLASVLLIGAGLLMRSFVALLSQAPGFRSEGVLTLRLSLPSARYGEPQKVNAFHDRLLERLAALPGVRTVGTTSDLPWTGYDENSGFGIIGRPFPPDQAPSGRYHWVSPDYFRAIGVPLIAGRFLTPADDATAPPVILINESLARRYWQGIEGAGDPVGARVQMWGKERTIVGVIGDVKDTPSSLETTPAFYFPFVQQGSAEFIVAVRSEGDPSNLAEPIRRVVVELDPELPVTDLRTLDEIASAAVADPRFTMWLVNIFAAAALFLAMVGIYGVMSQAVSQRTHEIGVRLALGAQPRAIFRLVVGQGMILALGGVVMGAAAAVALTRVMTGLLYGVGPTDRITFVSISLLLIGVALVACSIPARRAMKVDPMVALRYE
jgi:predicted permease